MLLGGAWLPIDHAGRRTSITTPLGGTTYFHYAGELLVAESDRRGNVTATYAWSPEGGLISTTRGGETYYYQTNAHGDVVSLTDSAGRVVNTYSYDPWGQILMASERVENPFRYGSCYYDTSTGLYYLWHRYYDPGLKRFLTPDRVFGSIYDPACANPYTYGFDNPGSYVDPTGLVPEWVWWVMNPGGMALQKLVLDPYGENAQDALAWWVDRYEAAPDILKLPCALMGCAAALMVPENQDVTITALSMGWGVGAWIEGSIAAKSGVCPGATAGKPKPSPKFKSPTNPPQFPPKDIPPGWRIREMPPTEQYPNGYWKLEKPMKDGSWQPIDPSTMRPGGRPETHIPFPPLGR